VNSELKSRSIAFFISLASSLLSKKTQRDENYPATIFFEVVSNGDGSMGLVGYHDIASTAIFCEGPDDQRSEEPTMNEMVDVSRVRAQG
jgi:hypothetical protein